LALLLVLALAGHTRAAKGGALANDAAKVVITGTVRDLSGAPVAGVIVSFHPGKSSSHGYAEVTTEEGGRYEVILPRSRFGAGSGPINRNNFIMARSLQQNLAAIVEFGVMPSNLDLSLEPGITLVGSVRDIKSAPLTNATAEVIIRVSNWGSYLDPQPAKADAQGSFSFTALPQGLEYQFFIKAKGYGEVVGVVKAEHTKTNRYEFPAFGLKRADR
jgi:hypothetical protein